jgi:hypothetical protein
MKIESFWKQFASAVKVDVEIGGKSASIQGVCGEKRVL